MDRAETVRLLAEVFHAEGYSDRWRTLMDSIREYGPLHDPEFMVCEACGAEFELLTNGLARGGQVAERRSELCRACQNLHYKRSKTA